MTIDLHAAKLSLSEVGRRVYAHGWVASNDGNFSMRLGPNEFLVTPSGISKGSIDPSRVLMVDAQGNLIEGQGRVSTEWRMHQKVYEKRPDVGAVVHTHAPHATAFAVAGEPLDLPVLPELIYAVGSVPLVPYALPGSGELYDAIDSFVTRGDALLLRNHGLVTYARDLWGAYYLHEAVEHSARIQILARQVGRVGTLNRAQVEQLRKAREQAGIRTPWPAPRILEQGSND